MVLDGHIHIGEGEPDPGALAQALDRAAIDGGILISQAPASFDGALKANRPAQRLDNLLAWCTAGPQLYPLYWIDPLETDALEQVDLALSRGVAGFKVICDHFYPGDADALRTFRSIADAGRPILFHSGILWDGKPSSQYNRPANFEALLAVDGLRFALAHISWPWHDECIALYGKIGARCDVARRQTSRCSSTPRRARRPSTVVMRSPSFSPWAMTWRTTSSSAVTGPPTLTTVTMHANGSRGTNGIMTEVGVDEATQEAVFSGNLKRFLGL